MRDKNQSRCPKKFDIHKDFPWLEFLPCSLLKTSHVSHRSKQQLLRQILAEFKLILYLLFLSKVDFQPVSLGSTVFICIYPIAHFVATTPRSFIYLY